MKYDPDAWAAAGERRGHEIHRDHVEASRRLCAFPSDASDWDIADASPYGKDLIGPLAEAAREQGTPFGTLLLAGPGLDEPRRRRKPRTKTGKGWDPAQDGDFDQYLDDVAVPQVEEILSRYKPDVLWWDTP